MVIAVEKLLHQWHYKNCKPFPQNLDKEIFKVPRNAAKELTAALEKLPVFPSSPGCVLHAPSIYSILHMSRVRFLDRTAFSTKENIQARIKSPQTSGNIVNTNIETLTF